MLVQLFQIYSIIARKNSLNTGVGLDARGCGLRNKGTAARKRLGTLD